MALLFGLFVAVLSQKTNMLLGLICDVPYIFSFCSSLIYNWVQAIYCVMENCVVQFSEIH